MDYSDIKEKLSSLNDVSLSQPAEERIRQNIQQEIVRYRDKGKRGWRLNRLGGVFASVAAVVLVAVGYFGVTHNKGTRISSPFPSGQSTTARQHAVNVTTPQQNTSSNSSKVPNATPQLIQATYTKAEQTQMLSVAQAVGVTGYVPTKILSGDSYMFVKNGGTGTLIIDYHSMWLIETNQPQTPTQQTTNRALKMGKTYITVQNMRANEPLLDANVQAIMNSFVPVSQLSVK